MSTRIPKNLLTKELTTTASASAYTAPANTRTTISGCSVTNKTATARYVTVTYTPSGGSAFNVCYQRIVAPNETFIVGGLIAQTLNPADKVEFLAEANSALDLALSGYEFQP